MKTNASWRLYGASLFWFFVLMTPGGVQTMQPFQNDADCEAGRAFVSSTAAPAMDAFYQAWIKAIGVATQLPSTFPTSVQSSQCFEYPAYSAP